MINELVEYSEKQRNIIDQAQRLGISIENMLNPDLDIITLHYLYDLARFNITVDIDDVERMNGNTSACYKYSGFLNKTTPIKNKDLELDEILLINELGIGDRIDYKNDNVHLEVYKHKTGRDKLEPRKLQIMKSAGMIHNEISYARAALSYAQVNNRTDIVDITEEYDFQIGSINLINLELFYNNCPNLDEIICLSRDEAEKYRKAENISPTSRDYRFVNMRREKFMNLVQTEYNSTGRCSILIDPEYNIHEKEILLQFYLLSGIDLRVLPNTKDKINTVDNILLDENSKGQCELLLQFGYTTDELKHYREMSNLFRRERLLKNQQKNRDLV